MEKNGIDMDSLTVYSLGQGDVFNMSFGANGSDSKANFTVQILTTLTTSIVAIIRIIRCQFRANTVFCQAIIA